MINEGKWLQGLCVIIELLTINQRILVGDGVSHSVIIIVTESVNKKLLTHSYFYHLNQFSVQKIHCKTNQRQNRTYQKILRILFKNKKRKSNRYNEHITP